MSRGSAATLYEEVAAVSVVALVRLAEPAASLPVIARSIRARHGGAYRSVFRGRGMEFDEVRPYQPGDDVRSLDWKVTARTGQPFTKLFREERERPVFVCVDLRQPMFFATRGAFKVVLACYSAALLAWNTSRAGDRVGGLLFAEDFHRELKPQRGKAAVLHLLRQLATCPAWQRRAQAATSVAGEPLANALARLRRVARPGSVIFFISDFRGLDSGGELQIIGLSRHNDVVLLFVNDPLERRLPPPGRYRLTDGQRDVELDTADAGAARRYGERHAARRRRLQELARRDGIRLIELPTDADLLATLKSGLLRQRP
jgi:uncharacterized protein (DUF58 family)